MAKIFQKNNQSFICVNCGHDVPEHPTSSRDHCSNCLFGLHVDINPGDRANLCKGFLEPIGVERRNGKERIVYTCKKCSARVYCVVAPDDDRKEILRLFQAVWK